VNAAKTNSTVKALFTVALAKYVFFHGYAKPPTLENPDFILSQKFFTVRLIFDANFLTCFKPCFFCRLVGLAFRFKVLAGFTATYFVK